MLEKADGADCELAHVTGPACANISAVVLTCGLKCIGTNGRTLPSMPALIYPAACRRFEPIGKPSSAADLVGALEVRRLVGTVPGRDREGEQQDRDEPAAQIDSRIGGRAGDCSKVHDCQSNDRDGKNSA